MHVAVHAATTTTTTTTTTFRTKRFYISANPPGTNVETLAGRIFAITVILKEGRRRLNCKESRLR